jgi:hypothetical protein
MNRSLPFAAIVVTTLLAGCGQTNPHLAAEPATTLRSRTPVASYSGLASPESVVYDAENDRYLVSNVNGRPDAKDGNGFISALSPDGRILNLKWLEGGRAGVLLDAPKGLAIANGTLYVADIDVVRLFDARSGKYNGAIGVAGSTYLSDVSPGKDGELYVTDAGPPRGSLDAVGTEAVYVIRGTVAKKIAQGSLGRPTSVVWTEDGVVVAPFGSSEVYRLDANGQKTDITKTPAGGLAGVVKLGEWFFVTSFQSDSVYRGKLGGRFDVALTDQIAPADLAYDTKRGRLVVPHFTSNTVDAFELE